MIQFIMFKYFAIKLNKYIYVIDHNFFIFQLFVLTWYNYSIDKLISSYLAQLS